MCVCVCVCVCEREREGGGETKRVSVIEYTCKDFNIQKRHTIVQPGASCKVEIILGYVNL